MASSEEVSSGRINLEIWSKVKKKYDLHVGSKWKFLRTWNWFWHAFKAAGKLYGHFKLINIMDILLYNFSPDLNWVQFSGIYLKEKSHCNFKVFRVELH